MITVKKIRDYTGTRTLELTGLSTDTKPIDKIEGTYITNGSTLFCMDDSTVFMFDEENKKWHKQ